MNVFMTEHLLVVFLTLIGVATLILLFRHKYLLTFISLIIIGCIHSVFSALLILETYLDIPTSRLFGNDSTYIFSMICFTASAAFVFADVILECKSTRIYFAVSVVFSLVFIIVTRNGLTTYMFTHNHEFELSEFLQCTKTLELKLWKLKVLFCSNVVYSSLIGLLLQYFLIYIPMSIMFYMKLYRTSTTFNGWWSLPSEEKCQGCLLSVSLGHHIIMFVFVVVWLIRPLNFIIDSFTFSVRNNDIMPMISMLTIYISIIYHIIKFYGYGKGCPNKECLKIRLYYENKTEV